MEPTLDELRAAFASDSTNPLAYRALAEKLAGRNEPRELAELHEKWAESCTEPSAMARALAAAGEQREAFGDLDRAVRHHARALELDPRQAVAAPALVRLTNELRDAHRHVDQLTRWAARLAEVGASASERAEAELALARAHATIPGRLDRCFEHHRAAVALDPELEGTLDEAVERAQKARRTHDVRTLLALAAETTRSPERKLALLRALVEARKALPADQDGALEALAAISSLAPDDLATYAERIGLLEQRARRKKGTDAELADRATQAELELERARRLDPDAALAAVERALVLTPGHLGALDLLERLVTENPTEPNRARMLQCLELRLAAARTPDAEANARQALAAWHERDGRAEQAYETYAPLLVGATSSERLARGLGLATAAGRRSEEARLIQRLHAGQSTTAHERVALEELLARCLSATDLDTAERVGLRLLELVAEHPGALVALARVHEARGDHGALRGVLERRLAQATDGVLRRTLLRELIALADGPLGDAAMATDYFQRLAELDPRDAVIREELEARLAATGRYRALADVLRWETTNLESPEARKRALNALLALAEEHGCDATQLAATLRAYRSADPADAEARAALVVLLRDAGELVEAAALLAEASRAARDLPSRLAALAELAELLEFGLRDDEAARTAAASILELAPDDGPSIDRLERIALRHGGRDRMVEALEHRALVVEGDALREVLHRLARLHESPPADPDAAMRAYEHARLATPGDAEASSALLRLYESHERPHALARLLDELASETTDRETRIRHLRQRARVLRDVLRDADGAAECYREIRTLREDEEALSALVVHARAAGLHEELSLLLATRLASTTTTEEAIELGMERATLLLDHLDDPREAERELHAIRELAPTFAPALARLAALYLEEGDDFRLAEVSEAHLEVTTQPAQRAVLAKRLFGIYVRSVPDAERALTAARRWAAAAPFDLDALRALAERLDPETDAAELVKALDARADELVRRRARSESERETEMRDEALLALEDAMRTSVQYLRDVAHAETRLARALELAHDDIADVDRFLRLVGSLDAMLGEDRLRRAAATFLARKATHVARPVKEGLFLASADLFGGPLADPGRAFEVMRRAIVECTDHAEVLRSLVEYGSAGGFEDELVQVLAERFEASVDAKTARALQRERADLLYTLGRYGDAADAYHRLASMEPDNERARVRHRECLMRAERYQDLLITLGQALRRLGHDQGPQRIALLRDLARTWDGGLDDRAEALDAWKAVLAAAPGDPEATSAIERLTGTARGESRSLPPRRSLVPALASSVARAPSASVPPPPPTRPESTRPDASAGVDSDAVPSPDDE